MEEDIVPNIEKPHQFDFPEVDDLWHPEEDEKKTIFKDSTNVKKIADTIVSALIPLIFILILVDVGWSLLSYLAGSF